MNTRQLHKMSVNNAALPCQVIEPGISFSYEKEPRPDTARRGRPQRGGDVSAFLFHRRGFPIIRGRHS